MNTKGYVKLKTNGRLMPSWIVKNFSAYELPEIFLDGSDPCNEAKTNTELRKYQSFLAKYLGYDSPYKNILIYHGLGAGKTRTAINIYNVLYNSSPDWNVFVLLKATLRDSTWVSELDRWLETEEKAERSANVHFISYDAPNADKTFFETVKNTDSSKKSLYIIEECHNFINNVYSNMCSKQGKRALSIYEHIIQDKIDNDGVRVIMISGSPAINIPFELALTFNLLRPNIFPKRESEFNDTYITQSGNPSLKKNAKNNFQRRILGLISYYVGSTPDYFARKTAHKICVPMSEYQYSVYSYQKKKEENRGKSGGRSRGSGNYKTYTRQACNFVFPHISTKINGEGRPRPHDQGVTEEELLSYENQEKAQIYIGKVKEYVEAYRNHLNEKNNEDRMRNHTIQDDLASFETSVHPDTIIEFMEDVNKKKSLLLQSMYKCGPKIAVACFVATKSPGPALICSSIVRVEGLEMTAMFLSFFGFSKYNTKTPERKGLHYAEYHGGIDTIERKNILEGYNKISNKLGENCKVVLISKAGSEGISLSYVRQTHLLEPYWNLLLSTQMIGRGIRQCSHKDLPMEDRHVDVFEYTMHIDKPGGLEQTTDEQIEALAKHKDNLIQTFLGAMKEAAVDCELYKNHNTLTTSYRCFKFEEDSLLEPNVGPAYVEDIHDDMEADNGLNAQNTQIKRQRVNKISAVRLLSAKDEAPQYSKPKTYWYHSENRRVYDYKMKYLVGVVGVDDDGIPMKLNDDLFIITHVVPIPTLSQ